MTLYPANEEKTTTAPDRKYDPWNPRLYSSALLDNLEQMIREEGHLIRGLGPEFQVPVRSLEELQDRLGEGRFHLAVLGQFKRGKSTLLNALLGEEILPSSVIPLTAIPTLVRFGEERKISIYFQNGSPMQSFSPQDADEMREILLQFVSEAKNPKNEKRVLRAEVSHPSPILDKGVVLIDTPGIGSTFQHNTATTLQFLSQCDAGLFIISADPPITETEVAFLVKVRDQVGKLFFVLNKVDYLDDKEQTEAITFFKNILGKQSGISQDIPVFPVSAKQGLKARQRNDDSLWVKSGLGEISDHLINFLSHEKDQVLRETIARRVLEVLIDVRLMLQLKIKTLELPVEDLERRLVLLNEKIRQAKTQQIQGGDILTGDRKRVVAFLEEQAETIRSSSRDYFLEIARTSMKDRPGESDTRATMEALAREVPSYYEAHLKEVTNLIDREIATVLKFHQETTDSLITSVRRTAAEIFEIPYHAPESEYAYHLTRHPFWIDSAWVSSFSPVPEELFDRALPKGIREKRKWERVRQQIEEIVTRNVENLRWNTLQSIDSTFRRFGHDLEENLSKTIDATRGAIDEAYRLRKEHAAGIAESKARLQKGVDEIASVIERFGGIIPEVFCDLHNNYDRYLKEGGKKI
ncbi:MAG TPA: dynamin family protein [Methanoregulaceae archaeon]|nr:dynamin family protein [Methanoregulaceae archaeon]